MAAIFVLEENLSQISQTDRDAAFALLHDVVADLSKGDYVPSAAGVKNAMLIRNPTFSERNLGFRKFLEFLDAATQSGIVALLRDPNNHPRIYPVGRPVERVVASLKEPNPLNHGTRKLKNDTWRAFVNWGPRDYWRFWDRREGRIFMSPIGEHIDPPWEVEVNRFAKVEVVTREFQTQWMREFAQARPLAEREALLTSLAPEAPKGEFSRALRRLGLAEDWTLELQSRVLRHVEAWASDNSIGFSRLLESRKYDDRGVPGSIRPLSPPVESSQDPAESLRSAVHAAVDRMTQRELESLLLPARVISS